MVLADEPTANLDSENATNLLDIMEKQNRERRVTFLFSTHDPRVVERARRIATIEDGVVVSDVQVNPGDKHASVGAVDHLRPVLYY